jgi:hypothetical protein
MLIYSNDRSKRKKPSKKTLQLRQERKDFFAAILGNKKFVRPNNMPDLSCESNAAPASNTIPGYGFKRSVDDWKWKRDRGESVETIKEIERKKTRVAPAYNKGATQYITDGADIKTLGRKV